MAADAAAAAATAPLGTASVFVGNACIVVAPLAAPTTTRASSSSSKTSSEYPSPPKDSSP
jgi:hypothetical protein